MDGRTDAWMEKQTDGRFTDGRAEKRTDEQTDRVLGSNLESRIDFYIP